MSRGHGANGRILYETEQEAMYEYCCYNLNQDNWEEAKNSFDGLIVVKKECLIEPIIRTKTKKVGKNKRSIVKKIYLDIDVSKLLENRQVEIVSSKYAWQLWKEYDFMAFRLCEKIFKVYQEEGKLPNKICWFS